eukprot:TRINITY_DN45256_c0_g1_i1.p1 TRINITY_DN45256_c0_g1~~TRINITY_DN45256_c0_g1_i1.p1  ORF type:complete len:951 (-),score=235.99 TRINITY_DN45256_c0_g1_i1:283-3135(-)
MFCGPGGADGLLCPPFHRGHRRPDDKAPCRESDFPIREHSVSVEDVTLDIEPTKVGASNVDAVPATGSDWKAGPAEAASGSAHGSANGTAKSGEYWLHRLVSSDSKTSGGQAKLLHRTTSAQSAESCRSSTSSRVGTKLRPVERGEEHMAVKADMIGMEQQDYAWAGGFCVTAFAIVIILCIWSSFGLLPEEHVGHVHLTKTRVGHVHAPIFRTPVNITLHGTETSVFDIRLIGMSLQDFSALGHGHSRRLAWEQKQTGFRRLKKRWMYRRLASEVHAGQQPAYETYDYAEDFDLADSGVPDADDVGHAEEQSGQDHEREAADGREEEPSVEVQDHEQETPAGDEHPADAGVHEEDSDGDYSGDLAHDETAASTPPGHGEHASGHEHGPPMPDDHLAEVPPGGHHDSAGHATSAHSAGHGAGGHGHGGSGTLTYRLLADGKEFFRKTIQLSGEEEVEHFETVQVSQLGGADGKHYLAEVTADTSKGQHAAFMLQAVRMNSAANYRFHIGMSLFILTFASIVAEYVHRSYSAAIGASLVLCVLAAIQETPELHVITGMVDFGTLMLLFSMMILMQMLAMTGFFNWFALKVIEKSQQDPKRLFFLLTMSCGFMSMVLDNVTCVLLTGPLTYQIAKKMQLNPRYIYLAMTICATVGGTGTLIGDPPNIVIGMKLKLGFETFLFVNFPLVAIFLLPLCSGLLYLRFKAVLLKYDGDPPVLDLQALAHENKIRDEPMFAQLGGVLAAVLAALLLSPVHHIEPAWFTVMAMFACALRFDRHHMGKWLELVEWDTLFFFALLFVLVEALSELGVIRTLGGAIMELINMFAPSVRMYAAVLIILWVSGVGSAFLESLPYTTTMVYIIQDLMNADVPGVAVSRLVWPLSVGACVGGIGSIMGSSANLVCMAISAKNAEIEEEKVIGGDFLRHGFPVLLILLAIASIWLIFLLIIVDFEP